MNHMYKALFEVNSTSIYYLIKVRNKISFIQAEDNINNYTLKIEKASYCGNEDHK